MREEDFEEDVVERGVDDNDIGDGLDDPDNEWLAV